MNLENVSILAAGPGFIAFDKPAGLSVHNEPGRDALSVIKSCLEVDDELRSVSGYEDFLSPAHRLDRETSGILVFSTSREAAQTLQTAIADKSKSKKVYRAIVRGSMPANSAGTWNFPISDKAEGRQFPAGKADSRVEAITHFKVLRANAYVSELQLEIETGRQHQIRKHTALAKHPILGDDRYNDKKYNDMIFERYLFRRMLLHAESLEISDPLSIDLRAPIPRDFDLLFQGSKS